VPQALKPRVEAEGRHVVGARVVLTARGQDGAERAMAQMREAVPDADLSYLLADVGEFGQVGALAEQFLAVHDRLDVLIHNAGSLTKERTVTSTGHRGDGGLSGGGPVSPDRVSATALEAASPSRVIRVSSEGMYTQRFDLAALEMGPDDYDGTIAYARAKRAQLVLMHEWVRRSEGSGISFHAMHPGWADTPGIRHSLPGFSDAMGPILWTAEEGADTAVWLAASGTGVESTGGFWLDRRPRWEHRVPWTRLSESEFLDAGARLWAWCAERTEWDGRQRVA